jgi:hypothetical protein
LRRLKDEILDLEDLDGSVSLTDFSLEEFRLDLLRFLESRRAELEAADLGLYAVVPPSANMAACQPGALFCLRHRADAVKQDTTSSTTASINPLAPHYLVYVHDDGTVRFSFAQAKQTLVLLRELAAGHPAAFEKLCDLFDQQTNNGADMKVYDVLLQKAVNSIAATYRKRVAGGLQSSRSFILPDEQEQVHEKTDFDLVTWLVIKSP